MKKSVAEIMNGCQPEEFEGLLTDVDADLPDEASAERIKALAMQNAGISKRRHTGKRIAIVAAAVILIAGILVGCYVAERIEYDKAVKFFDLNDISTDGLERSDIKRVYRDITTERFAYDESYELLMKNSDTDRVEGVDISISNNINNIADSGNIDSLGLGSVPFEGHGDIPDGTLYFIGDEFEKSINGETVWRTRLPYCYNSYYIAGGMALIRGEYIYDDVHDYMHTCVALIDDRDGRIIWEKTLDSKYHFDEYGEAALTDDGRIALLTLATDDRFSDEQIIVFRELDKKGEVIFEYEQPANGIVFLDRLIPLSDGWLAQAKKEYPESGEGLKTTLMKLSDKGAVTNEWLLSGIEIGWLDEGIVDIMEYDGKILLSVQDRKSPETLYDGAKIEDIPENPESFADSFTDEWRDRAREEFSSVLFVCDPENGKPEQFYSVGGTIALKNGLSTDDDGSLVWSVGRIVKCGWCPWANSFQLHGLTRRYDYTFDSEKNLLKQERTDCFDSFRTM